MKFFDTHCHLNLKPLLNETEEVLDRAKKAEVNSILVPGCDIKTSQQALEYSQKFENVFAAVGIHPSSAIKMQEDDLNQIEKILQTQKVVAIGEIGLDYYHEKNIQNQKKQQEVFVSELALAKKYNLPVIIHSRNAENEVLEILQSEKIEKAVFHCFAYSLEFLKQVLSSGYKVSFTGIVTYNKAEEVREAVKMTPLESFFLETDAPYLAPQSVRGKTNEPQFITEIAAKIAEVKNETIEKIAETTTANALNFFWNKIR